MQEFPKDEKTFLLPASNGNLELHTTPEPKDSPIAIICHPHPLYGGTMQNKVVTTLAKTFRELNFRTIRFNFRGIGKSTGTYDNGKGELEDLLSIYHWIKTIEPETKITLAGFSFGAYIATKASTIVPAEKLICVAPAVEHFDMSELNNIPCPWILILATADEVVSYPKQLEWLNLQKNPPFLIQIEGASHFFHGKLVELKDKLFAALK